MTSQSFFQVVPPSKPGREQIADYISAVTFDVRSAACLSGDSESPHFRGARSRDDGCGSHGSVSSVGHLSCDTADESRLEASNERFSRVAEEEMMRINIEFSANLARLLKWLHKDE